MYEDQPINLQLWDTAGQRDFDKIRPLSYPDTDVFVICFSLVDPVSLENVETAWVPEIKHYSPGVPYILIGLKSDLRDEFLQRCEELSAKNMSPITTEHGKEVQQKIGALEYVECSALQQTRLKDVFEESIKVVQHPPNLGDSETKVVVQCCEIV